MSRGREFKTISIEDVRIIRGHKLTTLKKAPTRIPDKAGVYVWRYWPSFSNLNCDDFIEFLMDLEEKIPSFTENVSNSRVDVNVVRTPFGNTINTDSLLGFKKNNAKAIKLIESIRSNNDNRERLANLLEIIISMAPPLYVGKADSLQTRLSNHFERKTDVLKRIEEANISPHDVYISFIQDTISTDDISLTTTLEEILQRITNPPLTKRFG